MWHNEYNESNEYIKCSEFSKYTVCKKTLQNYGVKVQDQGETLLTMSSYVQYSITDTYVPMLLHSAVWREGTTAWLLKTLHLTGVILEALLFSRAYRARQVAVVIYTAEDRLCGGVISGEIGWDKEWWEMGG